jgi:hypothetical protein
MNPPHDCSINPSFIRPHNRLFLTNIAANALQSSFDWAADFAGLLLQDALVAE